MTDSFVELITLAEVARIAGQKRSTVGNWKDRIEGFPSPRGKGPKGPIYNRSEIEKWLLETGRHPQLDQSGNVGHLVDQLRDPLTPESSAVFLVILYSLRSILSAKEWSVLSSREGHEAERSFKELTAKYLPFLSSILQSWSSSVTQEQMSNLLQSAGNHSREDAVSVASAIIGMLASGSDSGKEELPPPLDSLVAGLAGKGNLVYDPAAHTGQLLVTMGKTFDLRTARLIGQEQNEWTREIAMLNLKIHGFEAEISGENALAFDRFSDQRPDVIVSNPPWGQRLSTADKLANDARWIWGVPGPGDGNMAWVQHCLYHLADHGRAVLVLPSKVLFEPGRSAKIRQGIIKARYLEAVFALPPGLLHSTKVGFALLVFAKGPRAIGGRPSSTLMVNLEEEKTEEWGRQKRLSVGIVSSALGLHQSFLAGLGPSSEYAAVASYEAIAENGFDITPKRYVISTDFAPTPVQFEDDLAASRQSLRRALEKGRVADRQLEQLLKRESL